MEILIYKNNFRTTKFKQNLRSITYFKIPNSNCFQKLATPFHSYKKKVFCPKTRKTSLSSLPPKKMGSKKKNPKQNQPINPNWAQLQQKLKANSSKHSRSSNDPKTNTQNSILGKRKERADEHVDDSQRNPLTPINDDCSVTDAIAMDCEMVGVGQGNRSALGRVTLVNHWGNVIYDEFVRPIERVVDFRTNISGIRPQDLRKAKDFPTVQKKVADLIKGRILVGHALRNDLKVLLLSHPKKDLRDTAEYQPFLKEKARKALRHLAMEFLGVKIQKGEHCPIEDARAAMLLYQQNKKEWEKSVKAQMRLNRKQKKRKQKKKQKVGDAQSANHVAYSCHWRAPIE